jgi:hypothetical protein
MTDLDIMKEMLDQAGVMYREKHMRKYLYSIGEQGDVVVLSVGRIAGNEPAFEFDVTGALLDVGVFDDLVD